MKKIFMVVFMMCIGIGLLIGDIPNVFAQEKNSEEFTLEEITVTAQKREENQQKVPISMEVITGDQMKELGQTDINQILANLSSATVNKTGSAYRIAIRGISDDQPENTVSVSTPTVAVNKDGVMTNRQQSGSGLYDIERVEVLVGPQSTLYASATPGGIVNVVSSAPKTDRYSASGTLELGNYNLRRGEGAVNIPIINDKMALRAAFSITKRDGYLSNGGDDQNTKSGRLRALFKPNEKLSFLVTGEWSQDKGSGFGGVKPFNSQDDKYYPDGTKITDFWTSAQAAAGNAMKSTTKKIYGTINWDLGPATLTMTPAFSKMTSPQNSQSVQNGQTIISKSNRESTEKDLEIRLASSEDFFFKWIVGVVYYKADDDSRSWSTDRGSGQMTNNQETKALYGNITYPLSDQLRITGGLRWTNDKNHTYDTNVPPGSTSAYTIVDQHYTDPDYKLGLEYDLNKSSMLYYDITTSYRTQGQAFDAYGNVFPPEKMTSLNIGEKTRFLNNKLQLNASAFYYFYENYNAVGGVEYYFYTLDADGNRVYTYETSPDGKVTLKTGADGNAKSIGDVVEYGLDVQASAILTNVDKLDMSVSLMKNYFKSLFFDYMDITNSEGIDDLDMSGAPKTFSPKVTITGSYSHNFNLWNGGSLTARLDARYKSSYIMTWSERELKYTLAADGVTPIISTRDLTKLRYQQPFYTFDLSSVYAHPNGKWTLSGYVKNVTNYAEKRSYISMGDGTLMISSPRTFGGVLSVKF